MIYLQLFLSFFQIGLFSVGGGYAAMPLIQAQVVDLHQWLSLSEFTDLITIAEMTPGPIAINSATFVGTKIAGLFGALIATFGCILPSCVIVSCLAHLYFKYKELSLIQGILSSLRPAVVALIASAGLGILLMVIWNGKAPSFSLSDFNFLGICLFLFSVYLLRARKKSPIFVMVLAGLLSLLINLAVGALL